MIKIICRQQIEEQLQEINEKVDNMWSKNFNISGKGSTTDLISDLEQKQLVLKKELDDQRVNHMKLMN